MSNSEYTPRHTALDAAHDAGSNVEVITTKLSSVSERVSVLAKIDGKLACLCPYLCDAASEQCDFSDYFDRERQRMTLLGKVSDRIRSLCDPEAYPPF